MMKQILISLVAICSVFVSKAGAQTSQSRQPATKPAVLEPLKCKRGELVFACPLSEESWPGNWNEKDGDFRFDNGRLKVAERAEDNHHTVAIHPYKFDNAIIQFSFRLQGAKYLGLNLDRRRDHVSRVRISPDSFSIAMATGTGPTTKSYPIAEQKFQFVPDRWYTMLVEFHDNEIVAQLDESHVISGKMKGLDRNKETVKLVSRGEWAWYRDVRIWKTVPNP